MSMNCKPSIYREPVNHLQRCIKMSKWSRIDGSGRSKKNENSQILSGLRFTTAVDIRYIIMSFINCWAWYEYWEVLRTVHDTIIAIRLRCQSLFIHINIQSISWTLMASFPCYHFPGFDMMHDISIVVSPYHIPFPHIAKITRQKFLIAVFQHNQHLQGRI